LFGFRFDVGLDPIAVNLQRMLEAFCRGCRELGEIWALALPPRMLDEFMRLGRVAEQGAGVFHLDDELWTRTIYEFARAYRDLRAERGHLLRSLTPLYLGRVASFVTETGELASADVERKIEELCACFEALKPELVRRWRNEAALPGTSKPAAAVERRPAMELKS
jgi:hypothetical protein